MCYTHIEKAYVVWELRDLRRFGAVESDGTCYGVKGKVTDGGLVCARAIIKFRSNWFFLLINFNTCT